MKKKTFDWKQFLKPDWRKIVIFAISLVTLFLYQPTFGIRLVGFPLTVMVKDMFGTRYSVPAIIINLIFWYLLSCLLIWFYDKSRKKQPMKPLWKKIVLFIIISVLGCFIFFMGGPNDLFYVLFIIFDLFIFIFAIILHPFFGYSSVTIGLVLNIIYWYFLSCFIVWVYDKMKKKKR